MMEIERVGVFQRGSSRVNHAGTGRVESLGVLVERLDDLVAMTGLFGQQAEDQQLQVGGRQFAPHAESPSAQIAALREPAAEAAPRAATTGVPCKETGKLRMRMHGMFPKLLSKDLS